MPRTGLFRTGRWPSILGVLVAVACNTPFGLRESNGVSVSAGNQQVIVTNKSSSPIFTFVIGRQIEARTDWIPCVDEVRCAPIQVGESRVYPYKTIMRESGEKEVVVRWWHVVRDEAGLARPSDFGSLVVTLF